MKNKILTAAVLFVAVILFVIGYFLAKAPEENTIDAEEYAEYEKGEVTMIISDNSVQNPDEDDSWRGEQAMHVKITSGQYKGQTMLATNYIGPLYGDPLEVGDNVVLIISTYANGDHTAEVYEYDRSTPIWIVVGLFLLIAVAVGGKTGAKSLVSLVITLLSVFLILIPALLKGAATLPMTLLVCAYITVVTMTILGGIQKKSLCAMAGTVMGIVFAMAFGLLAQSMTRVSGLRTEEAEPLLQLLNTGTPIGIRGLLVAGVIICSLGASMDTTMGISSSMTEIHTANPSLSFMELFRSGMNVGRDMVGTMTTTLVLAVLGGSFVQILYFYTLGLSYNYLTSTPYFSVEIISAVASSVGVILSIPLTALVSAFALSRKGKL
ncbi:MAG: YibE/F family protein [Ruminococcaceae bacterium]|nr:YibE/F family protein [Oscillospiraceae bacterium]